MGATITEKILARASGHECARAGDVVRAKADLVILVDMGWHQFYRGWSKLETNNVQDPEKVYVVFDHKAPAESPGSAAIHDLWRKLARETGIRLVEVGDHGISHQLPIDKGYARPGMLVVNQDTHANTTGGIGCFATALGFDIISDLAVGWNWYRVPETIRVHVTGEFQKGVMSRDFMQWVVGEIGQGGAIGKVMEFVGPTVDAMSIDSRLAMCNWSRKSEAVSGIVNPDRKTIDFVQSRTDEPFEPLCSDPDAEFESELHYDVTDLDIQVAVPPSPTTTRPLRDILGIPINQAFVGSCAGGRLEDMRIAAEVLEGRHVHPGVRCIISPASQEIYRQAAREGLFDTLIEAGALIVPSTCGTCWGGLNGLLGEDEVCIANSTENHPGRMGSTSADIYLANAAVVAASAVEGMVADPRKYLR